MQTVEAGGLFGYRFQFPAMRVGRHEVYWHRPLVAYRDCRGRAAMSARCPARLPHRLRRDKPQLDKPIELWPRLLHRRAAATAVSTSSHQGKATRTPIVLATCASCSTPASNAASKPLPRSLARQHCRAPRTRRSKAGSTSCPASRWPPSVHELSNRAEHRCRSGVARRCRDSLTYGRTATRPFEVRLLEDDRRALREGTLSQQEQRRLRPRRRHAAADCRTTTAHLEALGDYLLAYYDTARSPRAA